jgi:hypothetical protein
MHSDADVTSVPASPSRGAQDAGRNYNDSDAKALAPIAVAVSSRKSALRSVNSLAHSLRSTVLAGRRVSNDASSPQTKLMCLGVAILIEKVSALLSDAF